MNLALGCREQKKEQWIYYLKDGTAMKREEWIDQVKHQIKVNGHESVFENIKHTVKLWNKQDTLDEVALQVYASKYCTSLKHIERPKVKLKVVHDEMGCDQMSFY